MLVLSRKVGESIVIGDDVVVTILEIRGDLIRGRNRCTEKCKSAPQ